MRSVFVLAACYVTSVVGNPSDDWACNFVGVRLVRTPSKCDAGTCVGLDELNTGGLSCHQATALASDVIESISKPESEVSIESLLDQLKPNLWKKLGRITLDGSFDPDEIRALLLEVDGTIAKLYLQSPSVLESLRATRIVADLSTLVTAVMKQSFLISYFEDVYNPNNDLLQYHFVMDWISWFGTPDEFDSAELAIVQLGSLSKAGRYRELPLAQERRPMSAQIIGAIELVDLVDDLAKKVKAHVVGQRGETFPLLDRLIDLVKQWNVGQDDELTDLLKVHIHQSGICKNIAKLPDLTKQEWSILWHKTVLTFMEICRSQHNTADIVEAGLYLEQGRCLHRALVPPPAFESLRGMLSFMMLHPKRFAPGWIDRGIALATLVKVLRNLKTMTNVISEDGSLRSAEHFRDSKLGLFSRLRALGRGIGMVIASRANLFANNFGNALGLSPDLASAIHTIPADAPGHLVTNLFYIRVGIRDAMGGFGVGTFTLEQWKFLFQ